MPISVALQVETVKGILDEVVELAYGDGTTGDARAARRKLDTMRSKLAEVETALSHAAMAEIAAE